MEICFFFFKFCDGRNKRISNVIRCNAFNLTNCNWILISWMFYVIFAFGSMGKEGQKTKKKNNNNVIVKRSLFIAIFTYLSYWWWFTSKTYDLGAFLYISLTCKCICVWHNMVIHFTSAVFFCARPDSIFIHTQFHWYYEENSDWNCPVYRMRKNIFFQRNPWIVQNWNWYQSIVCNVTNWMVFVNFWQNAPIANDSSIKKHMFCIEIFVRCVHHQTTWFDVCSSMYKLARERFYSNNSFYRPLLLLVFLFVLVIPFHF